MSQLPPSFKDELRMSIPSAVLLQALLAAIYIIPIESSPVLSSRIELRMFEPVLFLLPILTLALSRWNQWVGRWFAVLAPGLVVLVIHSQLQIPGILTLLAVSTGLAAGLVGIRAAFGTALVSILVLLLYRDFSGGLEVWELGIAFSAILTTLILLGSVLRPVSEVAEWAWKYYRDAVNIVEENRTQRAELGHALEEIAHANRQLALLYEKQTALQRIAEEAERTKSAFVAKVSHEFRTPLNMIIGLASVMIENPQMYGRMLPPATLEDLRIIHRNCEHLASLVNDVLALSQAQSGQLALHRESLQIEEIIGEALDVVSPLIDKKNLDLNVYVPPELEEISCDRTRIRQVILNLMSNAARFTDQGGITLRVEDEEHNLLISVADTGPGISIKDKERIFEPFCQGSEQVWRDKGGSGLGLTISKQFVELHGGKIWLESDLGEGTTFFVSLPKTTLLEPVARPSRWISREWNWVERSRRAGQSGLLESQPPRPRVVLYDRYEDFGALIREYAGAIELEVYNELEETLESVKNTPAHAVLLRELTSPNLLPLFEDVRQRLPDTPLVGCVMPPRVTPALEAGANQYLVKPVHPSALHQAMQKLETPLHRVLIVDDDADTRRLLERMVRLRNPDLEVEQAESGEEAVRILHESPVDLLLLDLIMPDVDGMQVLQRVRGDSRCCDVPVIVISAQDPSDVQPICQELLVTLGEGIRLPKVLECALGFSEILFNPEILPDQAR